MTNLPNTPETRDLTLDDTFTLLPGDAIERLTTVPDESVHAVITDPPYGLSSSLDLEEMLRSWLDGKVFVNDVNGYDGAAWDNSVPGPDLWRQAYRTLVPGGFVLAFAAARTVHLTAISLELAGFEVRDLIHWVYAPGRQATSDLGKAARRNGEDELVERFTGLRATLRPGHEPIVVARKPFDDRDVTLVDNLLDFGVGAINHNAITGQDGRVASNVWAVHDLDCIRGACLCDLDEYESTSHATSIYPSDRLGDGALSVAKPTKAERPVGPDGTTHETVKPLALMRRLIEAVTQPGQVVLDPFLGSGTTAEAALSCGRRAIGCELEPRYFPLIEDRIERVRLENESLTSRCVGVRSTSEQPPCARAVGPDHHVCRENPGEPTNQQTLPKEEAQ
jgi:site-specific DNA-methyltransferase (adenine-specific)